MNKQTKDAFGKEFNITSDSFKLVQADKKIHDVKFDTKPTTFAKDALKRFVKNKSSVAGAFIIVIILLMAVFVPLLSPHDVSKGVAYPHQTLLAPRVFSSYTGYLDGTVEVVDQPYSDEKLPTNPEYRIECIVNGKDGITYYEKDGKQLCKFRYDEYLHKLGPQKKNYFSRIRVNQYIENGWMELGATPDTFKILDERCPIMEVYNVRPDGKIDCMYMGYKFYGYKEMPKFYFGTDELGRDAFTLVFTGLSITLGFAIFIATICFSFGLVWGSISGYFGGNVDLLMERFCELLGGVPSIVVVTLLRLHFGATFVVFVGALCLTGWLSVAARTRTQFYRFKGREYVLASRTLGSSDTRLIFKHILPNSLGTIVTSSVLMVPSIMFSEATLSYLGLGIQNVTTFGYILNANQQFLGTHPALIILPAIIISLLMISFNLFGNGLRDALNPSLKGSE